MSLSVLAPDQPSNLPSVLCPRVTLACPGAATPVCNTRGLSTQPQGATRKVKENQRGKQPRVKTPKGTGQHWQVTSLGPTPSLCSFLSVRKAEVPAEMGSTKQNIQMIVQNLPAAFLADLSMYSSEVTRQCSDTKVVSAVAMFL